MPLTLASAVSTGARGGPPEALYRRGTRGLDRAFGLVLERFDALGRAAESPVAFSADHDDWRRRSGLA